MVEELVGGIEQLQNRGTSYYLVFQGEAFLHWHRYVLEGHARGEVPAVPMGPFVNGLMGSEALPFGEEKVEVMWVHACNVFVG